MGTCYTRSKFNSHLVGDEMEVKFFMNYNSHMIWVNQHPQTHQLWMRLFWSFWDETKPFNLNQTKSWYGFFFVHWPTLPLDFNTPPPFLPPLPSSSPPPLLCLCFSLLFHHHLLLFHYCCSLFFINFYFIAIFFLIFSCCYRFFFLILFFFSFRLF